MSLSWELFIGTSAVIKMVLCLYRRTVWRDTGIIKTCHSAGSYLIGTGNCTENVYCTERKSTGKIQVETLIFTVFNDNGGIFAWKVKFTVFTVKNLFSS